MIKVDNHIHSKYSCDSNIIAQDLINKAISLSYSRITFTEHVDLLPFELAANGLFSLVEYEANLAQWRASNPGIAVGMGLEIGDYQRVRDMATSLLEQVKADMVLGAVHFLSDNTNVAIPLPHPLDALARMDYYRLNLQLAQTCDIDVLAHLGVYKRYYQAPPDEKECLPVIRDIFAVMISRGIALEINYSAYRKQYRRLMPDPEYISLYLDMGGTLFSIGSDSHHIDHFDDHYHHVPGFLDNAILLENGILRVP